MKEFNDLGRELLVNKIKEDLKSDQGISKETQQFSEQMKTPESEVQAAIAKAKEDGYILDTKVVLGTANDYDEKDEDVGKIIGYNDNAFGMYSGDRYPVIVEFPKRGTFEYSTDTLKIIG